MRLISVYKPVLLFPVALTDDASDVLVSPSPATSSNFGSPNGSGPDLDGMGGRSTDEQLNEIQELLLPLVRNVANYESHIQTNTVVLLTSRVTNIEPNISSFSAKMATTSAPSLHACARSKHMQLLLQAFLVRQDRGPHLGLTAPRPQGAMTQGHLKRAGIQDADSIHSQVQMTKMLEVPFSHGFLTNDAMQACPFGSKNTCGSRFVSQDSLQNRYHICSSRIQHERQVPRICGNTQG